jgi:hypothetical protein
MTQLLSRLPCCVGVTRIQENDAIPAVYWIYDSAFHHSAILFSFGMGLCLFEDGRIMGGRMMKKQMT